MAVELAPRPQVVPSDRPERPFFQTNSFILERNGSAPRLGIRDTQTQRDLSEISVLQSQFDRALGRKYDREDTLVRSYNPVIDRWRIEKLREQKDKKGENDYAREIDKNLEANLKERMQVGENVVYYRIAGGNLYSEDFPAEPFSDVLQRGAEYRLQHGTPEAEREEGEHRGFEIIRRKMTDPETPVGTRMTSFSPKGQVEGTSYDRNVVDEYELVDGLSGRYVKLTRRVVDFDEADYYSAALSLDPNLFEDYDGSPMDAWMLSHPVEGFLPELKQKGMTSEIFAKIWESNTLQKIKEYYTDLVRAETVDWKQIALGFNAFLNKADEEEKVVLSGTRQPQPVYLSEEALHKAVRELGFIKPEKRGGGGCPPNKGFNLTSNNFLFGGSSVSSFSAGAGGASKEGFNCPKCGFNSQEPIGNQCPQVRGGCGITKEQFALSGGQVC